MQQTGKNKRNPATGPCCGLRVSSLMFRFVVCGVECLRTLFRKSAAVYSGTLLRLGTRRAMASRKTKTRQPIQPVE